MEFPEKPWRNDKTCCCVYSCDSMAKRNRKLSFHYFPKKGLRKVKLKNECGKEDVVDIYEAWMLNLRMRKPATKYTRVCSLHFTKSDYVTSQSNTDNVLRRCLKKIAVPSVNLPSRPVNVEKPLRVDVPEAIEKIPGSQELLIKKEIPSDVEEECEEPTTFDKLNTSPVNTDLISTNLVKDELAEEEEEFWNVIDPLAKHTVYEDVDSPEDLKDIKVNTNAIFFNNIFNKYQCLKLPDTSWSVIYNDLPSKNIMFAQIICTIEKPIILKYITVDESLNFKLFVLNKEVLNCLRLLTTFEELQFDLTKLCNTLICKGGPTKKTLKTRHQLAYVDETGTWRHKECSFLIAAVGGACEKCKELSSYASLVS